jgi:hypothetical protein
MLSGPQARVSIFSLRNSALVSKFGLRDGRLISSSPEAPRNACSSSN